MYVFDSINSVPTFMFGGKFALMLFEDLKNKLQPNKSHE